MTLKRGDLVRVNDKTHDERMPETRSGMLIERVHSTVHYSSRGKEPTNVWLVLMTNGERLRFHSMYLERII